MKQYFKFFINCYFIFYFFGPLNWNLEFEKMRRLFQHNNTLMSTKLGKGKLRRKTTIINESINFPPKYITAKVIYYFQGPLVAPIGGIVWCSSQQYQHHQLLYLLFAYNFCFFLHKYIWTTTSNTLQNSILHL